MAEASRDRVLGQPSLYTVWFSPLGAVPPCTLSQLFQGQRMLSGQQGGAGSTQRPQAPLAADGLTFVKEVTVIG